MTLFYSIIYKKLNNLRNQTKELPGGRITFGGVDQSLIQGPIKYVQQLGSNWIIPMKSIKTSKNNYLGCKNGCTVILDTGTITIQGPDNEIEIINEYLGAVWNDKLVNIVLIFGHNLKINLQAMLRQLFIC